MGLFMRTSKDLGAPKRQAQEIGRNSTGSVPAEVHLLTVEPATGYINGDPIMRITTLVLRSGAPPVPATQSIIVPALQAHRLSPGARLAARVDPLDSEAFVLDW